MCLNGKQISEPNTQVYLYDWILVHEVFVFEGNINLMHILLELEAENSITYYITYL